MKPDHNAAKKDSEFIVSEGIELNLAEAYLELSSKLEKCVAALEWEKQRCGNLQEPLRSALIEAKEVLNDNNS